MKKEQNNKKTTPVSQLAKDVALSDEEKILFDGMVQEMVDNLNKNTKD